MFDKIGQLSCVYTKFNVYTENKYSDAKRTEISARMEVLLLRCNEL